MKPRGIAAALLVVASPLATAPAAAEVAEISATGFAVSGEIQVDVPADQAWTALNQPSRWWSAGHSWSGDAANLSLDPRAGGCFCETLPQGGSVEHMRIIHAAPQRLLRLAGALGPLQSEALAGTLTIELQQAEGGTRIAWSYIVGGFSRLPLEQLAPAVDDVLTQQFTGLADLLAADPSRP